MLDAAGKQIVDENGKPRFAPNRITRLIAEIAREHTDLAIGVYVDTIKATKEEPVLDAAGVPVMERGVPVTKVVPLYPNDARQRAADTLVDRGWGKSTQDFKIQAQISGSVDHHHRVTVNVEELKKLTSDELVKSFRDKVSGPASPLMIEHEPTRKTD